MTTDRQTDRNLLAIPRLHYMQRGEKIKHSDLCCFHMQFTSVDWSRSRSRSFWSRSHNRLLVSVSVSISVSHYLVSVLTLVLPCSGLINKPEFRWLKIHVPLHELRWQEYRRVDETMASRLHTVRSSFTMTIGCGQGQRLKANAKAITSRPRLQFVKA